MDPLRKELSYEVDVPPDTEAVTKRNIVACVARVYDPMGLVAPVIANAKMIIQELWKTKCDGDDTVPEPWVTKWRQFVATLPQISRLRIPRWLRTADGARVELHGFADASTKAYGCAIYAKVTARDGTITTNLILAKSRVAPKCLMTIPRLELCGAHLALKLIIDAIEIFGIDRSSCRLYTDSMIVLHWLANIPTRAKTHVANRVADTIENSSGIQWSHVATK